jgi:hypothetical protein
MCKKLLILSLTICLLSCKSKQETNNSVENEIQRCFIKEENFESTSMKIFLESTKNNRQIIDKFLKDDSELSFLSIINNKIIFAKKEKNEWKVLKNNSLVTINDASVLSGINKYAELNTVYKFSCPENYAVFDSNNCFQAFWIKKSGKMKFLYYSTTYDINKLIETDKQKVVDLMVINELFEKEK